MKKILILLVATLTLLSACTTLVPVINTFSVAPASITAGSPANLIWNVTGANTVTIDPGLGTLPAAGTRTVNPTETTAYTVTAYSQFGSVSRSVVLIVNPLPISIMIDANPLVISSGGSTVLRWNVNGASNLSIDQGIGQVQQSGSQLISPTQTTTYTLTAGNASGTMSKSVTVAVNPPINGDFTVSPTQLNYGQTATLTWNVTGSDVVTIDQGIGQVPAAGSRIISPISTTTYTLTGKSSCCVISKAATVTVGTSYPYRYYQYGMMNGGMMYGDPYYYYNNNPWGSGGIPGPYWYPGGNQSLTPFVEIFSVTPTSVQSGKPVLLYWNVVNATSITITGIGNVPANGSRIIVPVATTTYVLTASNPYADSTSTVTVTIVP
jgi:hypothetical protein